MDEQTKIWIRISEQLGKLNANMDSVLNQLIDHTKRISQLEANSGNSGWKDNIVKWLVIALIGCVSVIATLTGSSTLVMKIMGL